MVFPTVSYSTKINAKFSASKKFKLSTPRVGPRSAPDIYDRISAYDRAFHKCMQKNSKLTQWRQRMERKGLPTPLIDGYQRSSSSWQHSLSSLSSGASTCSNESYTLHRTKNVYDIKPMRSITTTNCPPPLVAPSPRPSEGGSIFSNPARLLNSFLSGFPSFALLSPPEYIDMVTTAASASYMPSPNTSPTPTKYKADLDPLPDLSLGSGFDFKVNPPPIGRPIRIYADGIYDMCHFGHAKALEQAKKAFDDVYLLVGVCSDKETHQRKGKTVMTETERYEALRHIKWVDKVIPDAPWTITQDFIDAHQIDYVAHDAEPYGSSESGDVYAFVKAQGKFLPTQRTDGISTSDLITRIVRDYDAYLRRNLERGVSAKDLNISFLKEQEIKTKKSIDDLRKQLTALILGHLDTWETQHHQLIMGFAGRFGAENILEKFLNKRRLLSGKNTPTSSSSNSVKSDSDIDE